MGGGGGGLGRGVVATPPPPFLVGLSIVVDDWDPDVWLLLPPSSNELSEQKKKIKSCAHACNQVSDDDTEQLNVVLKRHCHSQPPPIPSFLQLAFSATM